jgi:hypothetical protein
MQTFKRICIKDFEIREDGKVFLIKRGEEYITSAVNEAPSIVCDGAVGGHVVVFSNYWVRVPIEYFAGEIQFTGR